MDTLTAGCLASGPDSPLPRGRWTGKEGRSQSMATATNTTSTHSESSRIWQIAAGSVKKVSGCAGLPFIRASRVHRRAHHTHTQTHTHTHTHTQTHTRTMGCLSAKKAAELRSGFIYIHTCPTVGRSHSIPSKQTQTGASLLI